MSAYIYKVSDVIDSLNNIELMDSGKAPKLNGFLLLLFCFITHNNKPKKKIADA